MTLPSPTLPNNSADISVALRIAALEEALATCRAEERQARERLAALNQICHALSVELIALRELEEES
jgi:hypothetical protein